MSPLNTLYARLISHLHIHKCLMHNGYYKNDELLRWVLFTKKKIKGKIVFRHYFLEGHHSRNQRGLLQLCQMLSVVVFLLFGFVAFLRENVHQHQHL